MCLGIPGRIHEIDGDNPMLATVEVSGVRRSINIGLFEEHELAPGDWVLIHVGFAMSKIDEAEAERAMEGLRLLGGDFDDELTAFTESDVG